MVYMCLLVSVCLSMCLSVLITVWVWISVSVTACLYDLTCSPASSLPLLSDIKHILLSLFPPWSHVSIQLLALALDSPFLVFLPRQCVILCLTLPQSSPFLPQCVHASVFCGNHSKITAFFFFFFNKWINRLVCKGLYFSLITSNETLSIHPLLLSAYQAHGVFETSPAKKY